MAEPTDAQRLVEQLMAGASAEATKALLDALMSGQMFSIFEKLERDEAPTLLPTLTEVRGFQVRLDVYGAKPPIWRRLELPGDLSLPRLHDVIQAAMGWSNSHLHQLRTAGDHRSPHFVKHFDLDEGDDGTLEDDVRLDQLVAEKRLRPDAVGGPARQEAPGGRTPPGRCLRPGDGCAVRPGSAGCRRHPRAGSPRLRQWTGARAGAASGGRTSPAPRGPRPPRLRGVGGVLPRRRAAAIRQRIDNDLGETIVSATAYAAPGPDPDRVARERDLDILAGANDPTPETPGDRTPESEDVLAAMERMNERRDETTPTLAYEDTVVQS